MHTVKAAAASTKGAIMCAAEKELRCKAWQLRNAAAAGCQRAASWGWGKKEKNLSGEAHSSGKLHKWTLTSSRSNPPRPEETVTLTPSCRYSTWASLKTLSPKLMGPRLLPFLPEPATSELAGISVKNTQIPRNCLPPTQLLLTPSMGHMAEHLGGDRSARSAGKRHTLSLEGMCHRKSFCKCSLPFSLHSET